MAIWIEGKCSGQSEPEKREWIKRKVATCPFWERKGLDAKLQVEEEEDAQCHVCERAVWEDVPLNPRFTADRPQTPS